ncbi:MAG: hypothetical protein ACI85I_000960 [Arenicella sp.]|jgi:hypothetical protein
MIQKKKAIFFIVGLIGITTPFIPYFVIIEMFYLLIPFAIITIIAFVYLAISLFRKDLGSKKALFMFSIIPFFALSQIASGFTVDKVQRLRSNRIIAELEKTNSETGVLPEKHDLIAGIEYIKMKNSKSFVIQYSRGFMVMEKYDSEYKHWRGYGWND